MNNAELIAALRYCGNFADRDGCDEACPYYNDNDCPKRIMCDSADALEALQAELSDALSAKDTWMHRCGTAEEALDRAQLPKEGEWEPTQNGIDNCSVYKCSVCGSLWYGVGGYIYCPNCGARMREGANDDE